MFRCPSRHSLRCSRWTKQLSPNGAKNHNWSAIIWGLWPTIFLLYMVSCKSDSAWRANNRVKRLKVYYNDREQTILELEDTRCIQYFDIGTVGYSPYAIDRYPWTLKFEILEVYPGEKYNDTVISELYFDGIDVH